MGSLKRGGRIMLGPKALVASLVLAFGCARISRAQDVVPGGWSAQVGYQSFGAVSGGGIATGFTPGWGGSTGVYSPFGAYQPTIPRANFVAPGYVPPQRMANTLGPFGDSIRRTTRTRRGR
jgi:hypothetical protein